MKSKTITVLGTGYIGLPTAAMFSSKGFKVKGYDKSDKVRSALIRGDFLVEEGVNELLREAKESENFTIIDEIEESDIFIICVPTPLTIEKTADMSMVEECVINISKVLKKGNTVILESTSPPNTCRELIAPLIEKETGFKAGEDYYLAHSPERVIPGNIVKELVENGRIIGGINQESSEVVKELYETFVKGEISLTDSTTAEFAKLAENTYRDINIAIANEFLKIAEELKIDVHEMINLANKHPRVNLLSPGPGVGGHCIAVDPWFLANVSDNSHLTRLARDINDSMPVYTYERIREILQQGKITILGLTFKPDTDDFRGSPIVELAELLIEDSNYDLKMVDPYGSEKEFMVLGNVVGDDLYEAIKDSNLLVLGVNHKEYMHLDFEKIGSFMKDRVFFDTRGVYDIKDLHKYDFKGYCLGNGREI